MMKVSSLNIGGSFGNDMKLIIGTITYGRATAKYLPEFFASLRKQSISDFKIIVADNSEERENENTNFIKNITDLDVVSYWNKENIGFARGYNKMITMATELGAEYFLVVNLDVKLADDALEKMISALAADEELGSVSPKILKWEFDKIINYKSQSINKAVIDSCGIQLLSGLRFVDIGQAKEDEGQFDNVEILGPSGACGLFRISALQKIVEAGQYFDELMFMYKEDCDLAYRLHLAGFKSRCVSEAVVYHDRTVTGKGESYWNIMRARWTKNRREIKWSFMNQQIIYWKYWRIINWREKIVVIFYQIRLLIYILLFEQYLLLSLREMREKCNHAKVY